MQTAIDYKYLSFTQLVNIDSWDVKFFVKQKGTFNESYPLVLFGNFLKKPTIEKIQIEDNKTYNILGVRSYGKGVFSNRIVKGNTLKMREYYKAKSNHLFWCKVDTKNGAFGVIKDDLADGLGSSNMTFAEIDTSKINLDFLQLLFTSKGIMNYLDGFVTGTTNRKYIRPDQLLNEIKIPLPTLTEQEAIVNAYQSKIQEAQNLEQQAQNLEEEIERYLYDTLGIVYEKKENTYGLKFIDYIEVQEWGIDKLISKSGFSSNNYKHISLSTYSNLVDDVFRGKSPKYSSTSKKVILNQKCNRWNELDLNFVKAVDEKWFEKIDSKFLTKEGDVLINSTGEGTIGRSTFINKEFENLLYDSHLLLLRINESVYNPKLFVELFNSSFVQSQIEEIKSAQATKQTELGVGNLLKIRIPFIKDIELQEQIVKEIHDLRIQIHTNRVNSEKLQQQAEQEFEQAIFS